MHILARLNRTNVFRKCVPVFIEEQTLIRVAGSQGRSFGRRARVSVSIRSKHFSEQHAEVREVIRNILGHSVGHSYLTCSYNLRGPVPERQSVQDPPYPVAGWSSPQS